MRFAVATLFLLLVWQGSGTTFREAGRPEEARASSEALLRGRAVYEGNCAAVMTSASPATRYRALANS